MYPEIEGGLEKDKYFSKPNWWLEKSGSFVTVDGTQSYTDASIIPNDIHSILAASINATPITLIHDVREVELAAPTFYNPTTAKDVPNALYHEKSYVGDGTELNTISFLPTPDAVYTAKLRYEKRISKLSLDTDVPLLPNFAHVGVFYGTMRRMSEMMAVVKGVDWSVLHSDIIKKLNSFRMSKHLTGD